MSRSRKRHGRFSRSWRRRRYRRFVTGARSPLLYAFLAIPLAYLLAFVGFPIIFNVTMSVQEVTLGNLAELARPFVGFDNYREAIADPAFTKVVINSIVFVGANVIAQVGLGLGVALYFSQTFPGAHYLRGLLLSSWMLPALVVGALWKWIFATDFGIANFILTNLGIVRSP